MKGWYRNCGVSIARFCQAIAGPRDSPSTIANAAAHIRGLIKTRISVLKACHGIRTVLGSHVRHRTNRDLNNRLEQDHRGIKGRCRPMLGFKSGSRQTILPRPRRTPKLPTLATPHAPPRPGGDATLSPHAPNSHRARYSGSCLNGRLGATRMLLRAGSKADRAYEPVFCGSYPLS